MQLVVINHLQAVGTHNNMKIDIFELENCTTELLTEDVNSSSYKKLFSNGNNKELTKREIKFLIRSIFREYNDTSTRETRIFNDIMFNILMKHIYEYNLSVEGTEQLFYISPRLANIIKVEQLFSEDY